MRTIMLAVLYRSCLALLVLTAFLPPMAAGAARGEAALTFEDDVRPILKAHCFSCHGEREKPKGGVDLRLRRFMLVATDAGPVMVPGKPHQSLLVKRMRSGEMPKSGPKVPDQDIARVEQWIAAGAKTARPEPAALPRGFELTEEKPSE